MSRNRKAVSLAMNLHPLHEEERVISLLLSRHFEMQRDKGDQLPVGIYRGALTIDGFFSLSLSDLLLSSPLRILLKDNIEQK